jgi:uncharacterized membrane protein YgcG
MKLLTLISVILSLNLVVLAQVQPADLDNPDFSVSKARVKSEGQFIGPVTVSQQAARRKLILSVAKRLKFVDPKVSVGLVSVNATTAGQIESELRRAARLNRRLVQTPNFCDENYVGELMSFSQTVPLKLDDLLYQIHRRFNINFLVGEDIAAKPINIRAGSIPWNKLLHSQLFLSGVRASCIDDFTIQLVSNSRLPMLQDTQEVRTKFIKLRFLQPFSGGNVDVAGRSNSGGGSGQGGCQSGGGVGGGSAGGGGGSQNCGNFEKLLIEIEKILGIRSARSSSIGGGAGGGGQGAQQQTEAVRSNRSVSVVPGRNILVVRATDDEISLINQIIEKADRAPFQVIVRGLIYTANESRLRDIGVRSTIVARGAGGKTTGGIDGIPIPTNGSIFDFSTLIGTVDFNVQANALQTKGIISIKSRPFAMVIDGDTADLDVGRQIPVLIQSNNVVSNNGGTLEILEAGNVLSVTPQVIDDDNGKPVGVNLSLQLESNDVDTLVVSQGVPSVNRRSIQTRLLLNQETTVILGGFTVDSSTRDVSKTPGLGDIPILGYLFKRKVKINELNRLYFAISVSVVPYGDVIKPNILPDVKTDIPTVSPSVTKVEKDAKKPGN